MSDFNNIVIAEKNKNVFSFIFFFVACVFIYIIYYDSIFYGQSSYDDHIYLDYLRGIFKDGVSFTAFLSILVDFVNSNWHPVTILSLAVDYVVGGDNPIYFHVTNILIHLINVMMVFYIFTKLTGNVFASALTAVLFAIHPLNVESVVWISERKGLLSTLFLLMSLNFYILYKKEIIYKHKVISVLFFILSLLSKPTTATLPAIFILLDLTVFNDKRKIDVGIFICSLKDKAPYFIAGIGVIILAFVAQSEHGALGSLSDVPLIYRLETSVNNIFIYISKIFFPYKLASFYPQLDKSVYIIALYLIVILSWILLAVRYFSKSKIITFSILFFFIQIIPMSGLFQTGAHSIANRYMYVPAIGFFFVFSYFIGKIPNRLACVSLVLILSISLTVTSFSYAKVWRDDLSLWENNAKVTDTNYFTAYFYSQFLIQNGRADEAVRYFYNIIGIDNKFYAIQAIEDMSIKLIRYKRYIDAKVILEKAVEKDFRVIEIYRQLAFLEYFHLNNKIIAKKYIKAVLKVKPLDLRANRVYGMMLFEQKKYQEALNILIKLKENKYVDATLDKDILITKSLVGK